MPDSWDDLKEGDVRYFGFLKIDVIDHSALSRNMPSRIVEEVFDAFQDYVESKTKSRGGRKWSWQGDGGLFAFYGDPDQLGETVVETAMEIGHGLPSFNENSNLGKDLRIRIACHLGNVKFRDEKGHIHSDTLNFVAHLEEGRGLPDKIAISHEVYRELGQGLKRQFFAIGTFEKKPIFMNLVPIDGPLPSEIVWPADRKKMVLISGGDFIYGEDDVEQADGTSGRTARNLPSFYVDRFPVTNLEYKSFLDDTEYSPPAFVNQPESMRFNWRNEQYPEGRAQYPVVLVTLKNAKAYASWANKDLPNELQWEKAARGTDGRVYPWGNHFDRDRCNTPEGGLNDTSRVEKYPMGESPYGCYDMTGNVWEWTTSPLRTDQSTDIVTRGGSWSGYGGQLGAKDGRCCHRGGSFPEAAMIDRIGFRCIWLPDDMQIACSE